MLPSRQCDVGSIRSQSALLRTLARVENEGYREVSSGLEASRRASKKWIVVRKVVGGSATREAAAAVAMNTSEEQTRATSWVPCQWGGFVVEPRVGQYLDSSSRPKMTKPSSFLPLHD